MKLVEPASAIQWQIVNRNITPSVTVREKLAQKVAALSKLLVHFPPDALHLQVVLGRLSKRGLFDVRLTLRLPSNTLHAEKTGTDLLVTINTAVHALKREIMALKADLRHDYEWKRPARRAQLNAVKEARLAYPVPAAMELVTDSELAAELFAAHHSSLIGHTQRLICLTELTGELPEGSIDAADVVDEVAQIVLNPRRRTIRPMHVSYEQWFHALIQAELNRQLTLFREETNLRKEPNPANLPAPSESVPWHRNGHWDVCEEGPDADNVALEERLTDGSAVPPDSATAGQELVERLQQDLKHWSALDRQVFELYFLVGLDVGDITKALHCPETEIESLIRQAKVRLREFMRRSTN